MSDRIDWRNMPGPRWHAAAGYTAAGITAAEEDAAAQGEREGEDDEYYDDEESGEDSESHDGRGERNSAEEVQDWQIDEDEAFDRQQEAGNFLERCRCCGLTHSSHEWNGCRSRCRFVGDGGENEEREAEERALGAGRSRSRSPQWDEWDEDEAYALEIASEPETLVEHCLQCGLSRESHGNDHRFLSDDGECDRRDRQNW